MLANMLANYMTEQKIASAAHKKYVLHLRLDKVGGIN